ncbi:MAG: enoyl-CoA hydratase/isomerase family protein [Alphaproteobacteria bacterium]|nr:enoyl-CoA hydratase/isomerase family protein [Alphaproteobacteria bacterium]
MNDDALTHAIEALHTLSEEVDDPGGRVRLDVSGPVAVLTLDHPEARHALTAGMMVELAVAVAGLRAASHAAVVLRASSTEAFCAGGHLGQVRDHLVHRGRGAAMAWSMATVLDALRALPMVSVSLVQGPAVGGGAELLTATDHRVWATDAWAQFRQARLGVAAGWGGARRLVDIVGARQATRWLTTSTRIGARDAHAAGFADVVADDVETALDTFLAPVLAQPAAGVRAVKAQVAAARDGKDAAAQVEPFVAVWGGPAHRRTLGLDDG